MHDIAIKVENLSKVYELFNNPVDRLKEVIHPFRKIYHRDFYALKDVSFEIKRGDTTGIIGKNGSGKSTLLKIITGVLTPTNGRVQVNGRISALLELGAGFNPELTGIENVYFNGTLMGYSRAEMDAKIDDILSFADIGEFVYQPVKTYSSGMFVRLAFAVSTVVDPEILIVDEALSVGDMFFQAKCMTRMKKMIDDDGTTLLFVSHDMSALKSLCSRGIYLERGTVQAIGPAGEVAELYNRNMRIEMNEEFTSALPSTATKMEASATKESRGLVHISGFKESVDFEQRVAPFRYGDGGAKITFAELLDEHSHPINEVSFNQSVFVRVSIETAVDDEIGCNYYVMDEKKIFILGASLNLAGQPLMQVKNGGRYVVTFKTRLPLHEGGHSIQLQLVKSTGQENSAIFLDVIDDAILFKMFRREGARIWARAYVENEVEIKSC